MERTTVEISGMHCGGCVRAVEGALRGLPLDVERVEVGRATVKRDPVEVPMARIVEAIRRAGYEVREPGRSE